MTDKIDHSIDVRYEPDIIKAFNKFVKKWCGGWYPHLIDTDEQDGQFMREKIEEGIEKAYERGYKAGHESTVKDFEDNFELKPKY